MLTKAITALINHHDRFYADFIQQMDRVLTDKIPTAGVRLTNRIELSVNPKWWMTLTTEMQAMVLKHECIHIISEHIDRVKRFSPDAITHRFYNMCMDLAVNSLIPGFPDSIDDGKGGKQEFCTVPNFRRQYPTMKAGQTFEYYVEYMRKEEQDQKGLSEAIKNMEFDDHSGMYEPGGQPSEVGKQIVRHAVSKALETGQRAGTQPPEGVRSLIKNVLKNRSDWKRALRQFPEEAEVCEVESTRKVRNRRYGIQYPGDKKIRRKRIVLGFDVSGSITDQVAACLVGECDKIINAGAELIVMFFDTSVVREETWTKTPDLSKYTIPGGGGTLFKPVFDRAKAVNADALIMLTDGYNFDTDAITKPAFPVLYGIFGNPGYKPPFGKVVFIEEDEATA